jgi:nucleotide-binding universal stress UspA family protein
MVGGGMPITVVHVVPAQGVSARLETVSDEQRRRQSQLLGEAQEILARRGIEADLIGTTGDPLVAILAVVKETDAGTLVVGRGAHRFPLRHSLGDRLVRRAQCDVLVVH